MRLRCCCIENEQEGPVLKEASTRPISRTVVSDKVDQRKPSLLVDKKRTDRWKATGVIALAQANLKVYRGLTCSLSWFWFGIIF